MDNTIKEIAFVGSSGRIGTYITKAILSAGKHNLTAITRADSKAQLPHGVNLRTTDYTHDSLVAALKGQDALIINLAITAPDDVQTKLINAAADAGVRWILPNEFGSDTSHPVLKRNYTNAIKERYRDEIQAIGKSYYIAIVNNQWYEYGLAGAFFGIDIEARTVLFYDDGTQKANFTTMPTVGRVVAQLLALPEEGIELSLADYKNQHAYMASFYINQREMFESILRVTGTKESDWTISHTPAVPLVEAAHEKVATGDYSALVDVIYVTNFVPHSGNDYSETKKPLLNEILGIPKDDLDEATQRAIDMVPQIMEEKRKWNQ